MRERVPVMTALIVKPDTIALEQVKSTTTMPNNARLVTTVTAGILLRHQVQRNVQSASFVPRAQSTRLHVPQANNVQVVATTT